MSRCMESLSWSRLWGLTIPFTAGIAGGMDKIRGMIYPPYGLGRTNDFLPGPGHQDALTP